MTIRAVSFLLPVVVAVVFAHQTSSVDPAEATPPPASATADGGGGHAAIQAQYVESRTTSITVNWTVNSTASSSSSSSSSFHHDFQVLALSLTSGVVLIARPTNETAFTLTDLTVDTPYKICVVAVASDAKDPLLSSVVALAAGFLEEEQGSDPDHHHLHQGGGDRSCLVASTIPYVRLDSVLVFLAVVAFIALLIVAALVCWKRSSASAAEDPGSATDDAEGHGGAAGAAGADDDPPGFEEEDEEKKKGSDEEQPLLDSDNNQYPPPQLGPQKSSGDHSVVPEVRVESEVEPADHQTSELPADGPADKPIPVV